MGKQISAALIAALIAALLLAACGDSEEDGASAGQADAGNGAATTTGSNSDADSGSDPEEGDSEVQTSSLGKPEFVRKANAICKATYEQVSSKVLPLLSKAKTGDRTKVEARLATEVMAPALSEEAEQLQALGAPAGDEEQIEAILEAIEDLVGQIEDDPLAVVSSRESFAESADLAEAYGLRSCPYAP